MAQVFKIETIDNVANIEIFGDIGYIVNSEDETANTNEMAKQLNEIAALKVGVINLTLESLGGSLSHALSIYSQLRQTGATLNVYLRGANASSSTVIAAAAQKENIYMDNTGLFLVHKPMASTYGNENDLEATKKNLAKWKDALIQAYLNLGVTQEVLNDLMERNGGHGEWLTFNEAKEYGFVGNEWKSNNVSNYKLEDFTNKGLLAPKNIINQKTIKMDVQEKTSLFTEFKNWFKNEQAVEEAASELDQLKAENEQLKMDLEAALLKIQELEAAPEVETEVENVAENVETVETVEASIEERIEAKVTEVIKNALNPDNVKRETTPINNENTPYWQKRVNNFQNFKKLNK